jgi:hypothetical protein
MSAMGAGPAVSGTPSWLATKRWAWLSSARLRRVTVALIAVELVLSARR